MVLYHTTLDGGPELDRTEVGPLTSILSPFQYLEFMSFKIMLYQGF
jgi:hypothetical protein